MKDKQWTLIPAYKQAYRAIMMFKDEFQLDFINVEELGMREEEVDERVIENNIVMKLVPAIFSICICLYAYYH